MTQADSQLSGMFTFLEFGEEVVKGRVGDLSQKHLLIGNSVFKLN